jgi:hypothetical protein
MPVIYEHPGGHPRFFIDEGDVIAYHYGTRQAAFFVNDQVFYTMDGTPAFWIGEEADDVALHPVDAAQPSRFYFDLFDRKPGAAQKPPEPTDDKNINEMNEQLDRAGLSPADFSLLIARLGHRAAFKELADRAAQKQ